MARTLSYDRLKQLYEKNLANGRTEIAAALLREMQRVNPGLGTFRRLDDYYTPSYVAPPVAPPPTEITVDFDTQYPMTGNDVVDYPEAYDEGGFDYGKFRMPYPSTDDFRRLDNESIRKYENIPWWMKK